MRTRYLVAAAVALAAALSSANAQAQWFPLSGGPSSFYIGAEGGYTALNDATGHVVGSA
jgi:hypothetical protein